MLGVATTGGLELGPHLQRTHHQRVPERYQLEGCEPM